MNWLDRISLNRAAVKYARLLPAEMQRCWGAGDTYTAGQIRTAITALELPPRWAVLGYAAYLGEADFVDNEATYPVTLPHDVARATFDKHRVRAHKSPYAFETMPRSD